MQDASKPRSKAFTLVELLVVIAIIIVLASLLLAAVFKALDLANEAATRTEDTQLSAAIESFKTKYQAGYPQSRLVLCKQRTNYFDPNTGLFKSQLHQDSLEYLGRVWPRLDWTTPQPQGGPYTWQGIDWDNSGVAAFTVRDASNNAVPAGEIALEGEQCLVFFLGGIPGSGTGGSSSSGRPGESRHRDRTGA